MGNEVSTMTPILRSMKITPFESIFVNNCPECGMPIHKIRFKENKKDD